MKHLTILVPDGDHNLSSIAGSYKIVLSADGFWQRQGKPSVFTVQLAGVSEEVSFHGDLFSIRPHTTIHQIKKTDLVIIPSLNLDFPSTFHQKEVFASWLKGQYENGAEIASICSGAYLLASTGLLDGKVCSTHWGEANKFRQMFPNVQLVPDKIITNESGIYTNGGGFSFLNLILCLVEKYYDRPTALYCSKVFQIDIDRNAQSPFIIFTGQKEHGDEVIKKAQYFIESNISEKINVEELASTFAIGRRNFDRRFKTATGNTPAEYVQRAKMEAAKKSLESTRKNVNEVMYDVGYSDVKAFREVFKRITGLSPLEYKGKFNKEMAMEALV